MSEQKADRGPSWLAGVAIPDLPEDASDEEILAALVELDAAKGKLLARRRELAEAAGDGFALRDDGLSDEEAGEKSAQLMRLLAEARLSITESTGIGEL